MEKYAEIALNNLKDELKINWQVRDQKFKGKNVPDFTATINIDGIEKKFFFECKSELRSIHIPKLLELKKAYPNLIVITNKYYPNIVKILEQNDIGYVDATGAVNIKAKGMPFGEIEKQGNVTFKSNPPITLSMQGYDEVTRHSYKLSENFQIVTLAGLCIMKLISYNDSPDKRAKDIGDFISILENYFNIFSDRIIEEHSSLIAEKGDAEIAGAIVLGKEMNLILD